MNLSPSPSLKISQYLRGHVITQLVTTAVKLGLFDQLAKEPTSEEQLANFLKIDRQILRRYLRALEALELIINNTEGKLSITEFGVLLSQDGSSYGNSILCSDYYYAAWQELEYALKTGTSAFKRAHHDELWQVLNKSPKAAMAFGKAMRANSAPVIDELLDEYSFPANATIADLGAGDGTLLAGILQKNPLMHGLAIEQKSMIAGLEVSLTELGVIDRCQVICIDLLQSFKIQADIFILKSVLHNWDDEHALQILRNSIVNLRRTDRLLVLERAMDLDHPNKLGMAILDLTMLVLFGSQEREKTQYQELIKEAGFQICREFYTPSNILVIEAKVKV